MDVCAKCQRFMRCERNGVLVVVMSGDDPYKVFSADLWKCPSCGAEVIGGFGSQPLVEDVGQPDFLQRVESAKHQPDLLGRVRPVYEVR
jgi:hypothetical protein